MYGCAAPRSADGWFAAAAAAHEAAARVACAQPQGFAALDPDAPLASGDRVVYRLLRRDARGDAEWRLAFEIVDAAVAVADVRRAWSARSVALVLPHENGGRRPDEAARFAAPLARLRATVFDAAGELVSEDLLEVSRPLLEQGLLAGARSTAASNDVGSRLPPGLAAQVRAELRRVVEGSEGLRDLLSGLAAVDPWSVLLGLGAEVEVALDADVPHELAGPWSPSGDCRRFPLRVTVNGEPALDLSVVVAPSQSPFLPGAGIVSIVGMRPGDPRVGFTLQAIAAQRGRGAAATRRSSSPSASRRSAPRARRSSRSAPAAGA